MNALVIDLTHGGVKIAIELEKLKIFEKIYCFDIYKTLKNHEKDLLKKNNIKLVEAIEIFQEKLDNNVKLVDYNKIKDNYLNKNEFQYKNKNLNGNYEVNLLNKDTLLVTSPIHCPVNDKKYLTHHEAVELILSNWKAVIEKEKIPIVEVTGVKGKTSTAAMLKEILINFDPLLLSSLGAYLYNNENTIQLKKNISITPASILETINLANKLTNQKHSYLNPNNNNNNNTERNLCESNFNYKSCIFEISLGTTGIGNVGILTNIIENYPIAKKTSSAKEAKEQVFNCDFIVADYETLNKHYKKRFIKEKNRINTFSFDEKNLSLKQNPNSVANLKVTDIEYGLDRTKIKINFKDIKTVNGKTISDSLAIETFAPGKHHVLNVLASITTALTLEIDHSYIQKGLSNFKGIKGRSSQKIVEGYRIIEEINPGINIKAIESSIDMIKDLNSYFIVIGGKYGTTCEEIDEEKVADFLDDFLDKKNANLMLTDELGNGIKNKMINNVFFVPNPNEAQKIAISNKKNVLFIYRSNYSQLNKR